MWALWWLSRQRICLQCRRPYLGPCIGKIPWRKKWQPTSVFLPRKFHGLRSLVGYSPWGCKESDMTEQLHFTSMKAGTWGEKPANKSSCHKAIWLLQEHQWDFSIFTLPNSPESQRERESPYAVERTRFPEHQIGLRKDLALGEQMENN